jgi:hypothetical protein
MDQQNDEAPDVFALLLGLAESRRNLAAAMLRAYAANAFENPATPQDMAFWTAELADAEIELARLHDPHQT